MFLYNFIQSKGGRIRQSKLINDVRILKIYQDWFHQNQVYMDAFEDYYTTTFFELLDESGALM